MEDQIKEGTTVYAIDPCVMDKDNKSALVVGKGYTVNGIHGNAFVIDSESATGHNFTFDSCAKFFSLSPPKQNITKKIFRHWIAGMLISQGMETVQSVEAAQEIINFTERYKIDQ